MRLGTWYINPHVAQPKFVSSGIRCVLRYQVPTWPPIAQQPFRPLFSLTHGSSQLARAVFRLEMELSRAQARLVSPVPAASDVGLVQLST
jgi:hypothetical protein